MVWFKGFHTLCKKQSPISNILNYVKSSKSYQKLKSCCDFSYHIQNWSINVLQTNQMLSQKEQLEV
jgi:hypothetical protein